MKNILVISVNWLGDAVFSTPVFRALKENFPQAKISVLCVPRVKDVMALNPHVDEVIVYDEDGFDRPLLNKMALAGKLRSRGFDAVFILRRSLSRTFLCYLAGIPVRVGFAGKGWQGLLTHVVHDTGVNAIHRSDVYLRVVESFGVKVTDRRSFLEARPDIVSGWRARLLAMGVSPGDRLIAVNTGGNWNLKQWPVECFAELVREIENRKIGKVVLPGAEKDVERVKKIAALSKVNPIITAGDTGISCLSGLLKCCDLLVTADTGPLHLANALGVGVVALFGPTRPEITGPRGQGACKVIFKDVGCNRAPCYYLECSDNKCMKAIKVGDVLQAIAEIQG
ncbi:MAG: lipopolysaccharide heptosyltransferase II [Candidatus Omnitrophica bacterium]|nr:lipopolysaccharide heptosyltransferase II [Candidatus Omnitrophota bacterium]